MTVRRGLHWLAALLLLATAARAEMGSGDYELQDPTGRGSRPDILQQEIRREIEAERERERAAAAAAERARRAAEAAWLARPVEERLYLTRCAECHEIAQIAPVRHTRIGWELVTLRMRLLNDAAIPADERRQIVDWLARTQALTGTAAVIEYLLQFLALGALVGLPLGLGLLLRRRHRRGR